MLRQPQGSIGYRSRQTHRLARAPPTARLETCTLSSQGARPGGVSYRDTMANSVRFFLPEPRELETAGRPISGVTTPQVKQSVCPRLASRRRLLWAGSLCQRETIPKHREQKEGTTPDRVGWL